MSASNVLLDIDLREQTFRHKEFDFSFTFRSFASAIAAKKKNRANKIEIRKRFGGLHLLLVTFSLHNTVT